RVAAQLEHPNILPLKYADFIDGKFVIVTALGMETLEHRLQRRLSVDKGISFAEQMLAAVGYAHEQRIIHCDIKPDNFVLFSGNRLRLTDFGIARFAQHTLQGSGAGTVGYIAPEQAMGKPSFRSDVFSLGLVLYRTFTGYLPEWPFDWPPPGYLRLRQRLDPDFIDLIRKSLHINARQRFRDCRQMREAFRRITRYGGKRRRPPKSGSRKSAGMEWQRVRRREFQQQYSRQLETRLKCEDCQGPMSQAMQSCPWCGKAARVKTAAAGFGAQCPRCNRGIKLDWKYCAWCYGPGFEPLSQRPQSDRRYTHRCDNPRCQRRQLMPFMRYCPWCHRKVRKKWQIEGVREKCQRCGWGVVSSFWTHCPWCTAKLDR
ncbi:MAG: protein kinase, partial [Planctomycetales bacterium]|nr:protein kinase [Planctomycetales bacterium]